MKFPSLDAANLIGTGLRPVLADASGALVPLPALYQDLAAVASASTSKSTLKSVSLPAALLAATGLRGIRILAWGTAKATANNKTQTIDVGGTTVVTTGAVGNNNGSWAVEAVIVRKATDSQECIGWAQSAATGLMQRTALTAAEAGAILVEVTATNVTDTDGTTCTGFVVEPIF